MSEELKPCPFCGGAAGLWKDWRVICNSCSAEGPDFDEDSTTDRNIAAWNRRAAPAPSAHTEQDKREPCKVVAWRREWNGDDSDLDSYIYVEHKEDMDSDGVWEPLCRCDAAPVSWKTIESEEFYNLMQAYRHAPKDLVMPSKTRDAYAAVIAYVDAILSGEKA